jgi:hypothetical protein
MPAAPGGEAPSLDILSYTSLAQLERCGYRYYLERELGLPERSPGSAGEALLGGLGARERGTLVHRLLETFDFTRLAAPPAAAAERVASELGMQLIEGEADELVGMLGRALGSPMAERLGAAGRLRRELPFAFRLPGAPLVRGVIDVLAEEPGAGVLVVDYKTDSVEDGQDLELLTEREYGIQRLVYALACVRAGVARVEVAHWFLERPEERVSVSYSAQDGERLQRLLLQRMRAARERGFRVSERPHRGLCLTCPGRGGLCSWEEAQTLREEPAQRPPRAREMA